MTVIGRVAVRGRAARKARGAKLQVQFQAFPLFGIPRTGSWHDLGSKRNDQETFSGLASGSWSGVMRWRFRKGTKTVLTGQERARSGCTLSNGFKTPDTTPPQLSVSPVDSVWRRAPAKATILAQDDFSGVKSVSYSLDGGPNTAVVNGAAFTIDSEGAHSLHAIAIDVAGNQATRDVTMYVDKSAPTKPQLQRPFSITAAATPTFQWTASTDSGSGLKGYFLVIRRASDGSLVSVTPFDPATTSAPSPQALTDGETYAATVVAVDKTDNPFTTESDPLTFKVDTRLDVIATDPAPNAILSGGRKDGNLTIALDRPASPSTVTATVALHRVSPGGDPPYTVACSSPCTTITVHPTATLPEGRYTLDWSGVRSEEGLGFPGSPLKLAVAFREDSDSDNKASTPACTGFETATPNDTTPAPVTITTGSGETGIVTYDYQLTGSGVGGLRVFDGATMLADTLALTGNGTGKTLAFAFGSAGSHTVSIQYYAKCDIGGSVTTFTASNVIVSRTP